MLEQHALFYEFEYVCMCMCILLSMFFYLGMYTYNFIYTYASVVFMLDIQYARIFGGVCIYVQSVDIFTNVCA